MARSGKPPILKLDQRLESVPDFLPVALTTAQACLWRFGPGDEGFSLAGGLAGLARPLSEIRQLTDLASIFPDAALDQVRRAWVQMRRRKGEAVSTLVRAQDGRDFLLRGALEDVGVLSGVLMQVEAHLLPQVPTLPDELGRAVLALNELRVDSLTGLLNRHGFLRAAEDLLSHEGDFDLVVADINRFRRLNEALGHERADMVLALLARRLSAAFPTRAVLARLGEDEFCVLTERGFPRVSERVRGALEQPVAIAGFELHPTLSLGALAVEGGDKGVGVSELMRRVEMALEAAKLRGAGTVAAYRRDLESDGISRLALEAELRKAFVGGGIEAWFQPIVDMTTGKVAGFEALARWNHRRRGVISPMAFLACAAEMGLMTDLGRQMTAQATARLGQWRAAGLKPDDLYVSVNLSAGEIERPFLIEEVTRLLNQAGLPPACLKFEVTESDVIRNPETAVRVLESLRDLGVGLALDDFGTGYSSLSYLARLPIDTVKIDQSFIVTLGRSDASDKIVRAILNLGRDLGLDVVAEGVETPEDIQRLTSMGARLGQGYVFSKPLKAPKAEALLSKIFPYQA